MRIRRLTFQILPPCFPLCTVESVRALDEQGCKGWRFRNGFCVRCACDVCLGLSVRLLCWEEGSTMRFSERLGVRTVTHCSPRLTRRLIRESPLLLVPWLYSVTHLHLLNFYGVLPPLYPVTLAYLIRRLLTRDETFFLSFVASAKFGVISDRLSWNVTTRSIFVIFLRSIVTKFAGSYRPVPLVQAS